MTGTAARRILVVADYFYPSLGGSARVIGESGHALRRLGHDVWIVAGNDDPRLPAIEDIGGLHVARYAFSAATTLQRNATAMVNAARAVSRVIREHGPFDVMHAHGVYGATGALLARSARSLPRVSTFHGPVHQEFEVEAARRTFAGRPVRGALQPAFTRVYSGWLRRLQARVVRSGPCIVLSDYAAGLLRQVAPGHPVSLIRVVPGGVDLERFQPADPAMARASLGLPATAPLVVTVRRLVPRMGLEDLVDAFAGVRARRPAACLVVGGAGSLAPVLRDRAAVRGLDGAVRFPGLIPEQLLATYYQGADAFVVPSRALEGFGLVTLEALACGTPVIATRIGGSVEILRELGDEFLVPAENPDELASALIRVLDAVRDGPLRQRCRAFVADRYSWDRAARRLSTLYDEIASPRP